MKQLIQFYENGQTKSPAVRENEQGSAMIYLICVILIMSVLGAAMHNFVSTSTLGQVSANHMDRAYFMAEAGVRYAVSYIMDGTNNYDDINEKTFILDNGGADEEGQFEILVDDDPSFIQITAKGIINVGSATDVEAKLICLMSKMFDSSIFSNNKPIIKKDVHIEGDVGTNDASIDKSEGVIITGDVKTSAGKSLDSIVFPCDTCSTDTMINNNAPNSFWYSGTYEYKNLTIGIGTIITISGKVILYVKDKLLVEKESTFKFLEGSSLTVYVDGNAVFNKEFTVEFDPPGSDLCPETFIIFGTSNAEIITVEKDSTFIGAVYAPDAKINVQMASDITGALIGDEITIEKNAKVIFDPAVGYVFTADGGNVELSHPVQYFSR